MDKFVSLLGVLIAIMLILFVVVGRYWSTQAPSPSFASCDQIEDKGRRTVCLRELAFKNLDVTPCLQIENTPERDICLRNVAIKSRDGSLCQQITTKEIRASCLREVG